MSRGRTININVVDWFAMSSMPEAPKIWPTAVTLWQWMFWLNWGLHALFLVVALIAVFR